MLSVVGWIGSTLSRTYSTTRRINGKQIELSSIELLHSETSCLYTFARSLEPDNARGETEQYISYGMPRSKHLLLFASDFYEDEENIRLAQNLLFLFTFQRLYKC